MQQVSIAELTVQWQMIQNNNNAIFSLGNEKSKGHTENRTKTLENKEIAGDERRNICWRLVSHGELGR